MNPLWQQKKLREFCENKGIRITAYSPLGAKGTLWGTNWVMECEVLKQIAEATGKTIAQVIIFVYSFLFVIVRIMVLFGLSLLSLKMKTESIVTK